LLEWQILVKYAGEFYWKMSKKEYTSYSLNDAVLSKN